MNHSRPLLRAAVILLAAQVASFSSLAAQSSTTPANSLDIPTGERLILQLEDSLHTRTSKSGDRVHFRTVQPVLTGGQVAIPAGSSVAATVSNVHVRAG